MSAPEMHEMTNCPTDETLAAFVDRKLEGAERDAVVAHLADCADCRDIVVMATEEASAGNVVPFRKAAMVMLAAAAAVVVMLFAIPSVRERILGDDLREVNRAFALRQTEGRLSIDETHRTYDSPERGVTKDPELKAQIAAADARLRVEEKPTRENLHKAGLALLLARDAKDAVDMLERALKLGASVELLNDTAAAHIAFGRDPNLLRALELSEQSLRIERAPAALWNRALALQHLQRDDEAVLAWEQYIAAEPDPAWDQDAGDHIARIKGF